MEGDITLYYLQYHGKAEAIRMLLNHAKKEYKEVLFPIEEWLATHKHSGKFEFKQVPALEMDGKVFVQSRCIMRMLGKKLGYYPEDKEYEVESIIETFWDMYPHHIDIGWYFQKDSQKSQEMRELFVKEKLGAFLEMFETRLKNNESQEYMVGNKWSIADF